MAGVVTVLLEEASFQYESSPAPVSVSLFLSRAGLGSVAWISSVAVCAGDGTCIVISNLYR